MLDAAEPQNAPIVVRGPFVSGSRADTLRVSRDYVAGRFRRMSALLRARRAADAGQVVANQGHAE